MQSLSQSQTFGDLVSRAAPLIGAAGEVIDDSDTPSVWTDAGLMLASMLDDCQHQMYADYQGPILASRFSFDTTDTDALYDVPSVTDSDGNVWTLNLNRITGAWVVVGTTWEPLTEGFSPALYTDSGTRYPYAFERRFDVATGKERIELYPQPDAAYTCWFIGARAIPAEMEPATLLILPAEPVYASFMGQVKAHFQQPDAAYYLGWGQKAIAQRVGQAHGTRRYIPGRGVAPPRPLPKIAQT